MIVGSRRSATSLPAACSWKLIDGSALLSDPLPERGVTATGITYWNAIALEDRLAGRSIVVFSACLTLPRRSQFATSCPLYATWVRVNPDSSGAANEFTAFRLASFGNPPRRNETRSTDTKSDIDFWNQAASGS